MDSGARAVWLEAMLKDLKRLKGIQMLVAVPIAVFGTFWRAFAAKVATNAQQQGRTCESDIILKVMMRLHVWRIPSAQHVLCAKMRERFDTKRLLEGQMHLW